MFQNRMKNSIILYISVPLLILGGCKGFEKVVKSSDYVQKYETAKGLYDQGEYYKASVLFDQIANIYRGTNKADTVYYYQAMSYFKQEDYLMAGHYFETFSQTYGASSFVEDADYMTAYCYYRLSPRAELDQTNTQMAIQYFQKFVSRFPKSDKKPDALAYIKELQDKLVEKSFISARLYYDLEDYKASQVSLNNSLNEYPNSRHREDLMFMLFKSSFKYADNSVPQKKRERYQASLDDYYSFVSEYPDSKYTREAERYYHAAMKYLGNDITEETGSSKGTDNTENN